MKSSSQAIFVFLIAGFFGVAANPVVTVAAIVYGNLGSDGSGALSGTNTDVTNTERLAQGFSTGSAADRVVQSITLGLFYDASTTVPFSLSIYSDNAGVPGSVVATSSSVSVGNTGKYTFPFANPTLQSGTNYWIVPEVDLSWYTNSGFTTPAGLNSSGYTYLGTLQSLDGGTNWSNSGLTSYSVSIVAVPEPATVGLLAAAGLAGGFALVRRRR